MQFKGEYPEKAKTVGTPGPVGLTPVEGPEQAEPTGLTPAKIMGTPGPVGLTPFEGPEQAEPIVGTPAKIEVTPVEGPEQAEPSRSTPAWSRSTPFEGKEQAEPVGLTPVEGMERTQGLRQGGTIELASAIHPSLAEPRSWCKPSEGPGTPAAGDRTPSERRDHFRAGDQLSDGTHGTPGRVTHHCHSDSHMSLFTKRDYSQGM